MRREKDFSQGFVKPLHIYTHLVPRPTSNRYVLIVTDLLPSPHSSWYPSFSITGFFLPVVEGPSFLHGRAIRYVEAVMRAFCSVSRN